MFRITSSVITARSLLYRHSRPDIHLAAFSRFPVHYAYDRVREREPCPPIPPPIPPPKKPSYFLISVLLFAAMAGGFAVYAKTDPELRDWLTINAPWLDDFVAIVHQENLTYQEFAVKVVADLATFFKEDPKCTSDGKPIIKLAQEPPECAKLKKEAAPTIESDYVIVNLSNLDSDDVKDVDDDEQACIQIPPPILTKDICEVETCLKDIGDSAIFNYMTARDACRVYNQQVQETMQNFTVPRLKCLHAANKERVEMIKTYVAQAKCAVAKLDELSRFFECGVEAPKDAIKNTKDLLREYNHKIKTLRMQWQWENDRCNAMDEQWRMVEQLVDKYTGEVVMMNRGLDYNKDRLQLRGDADMLLYHTLRYVEDLTQELKVAQATMTDRINRGMDTLPPPADEKAAKERQNNIEILHKKVLMETEAEYVKRYLDHKTEIENVSKEALKQQMDKLQDTFALRLEQKTQEIQTQLEKMVANQVEIEKKDMARETELMAEKLRSVEVKLEARLKAEREARRSQDLYTAGSALLAATKKGDPIVKVDKEIKAIEKASGDGDPLVSSVLKAIPRSVREKGVVPETVIRQKFHVMEDVALKVALVEQEGAPLPVYMLSLIQSIFLFMKISGIPQKEYENPPSKISPGSLDTFDLLQRARFWMDRGNIAIALKYVSALEGASLAATQTWQEAARAHLETKQAAEAVLAHATALGLQFIQQMNLWPG